MQLAEIYLEAVNPARDCMRGYRLTLTEDLFGTFIVETRYGRIGASGHVLARSFDTEDDARQFIAQCLRRRESAPKRHGVSYIAKWSDGIEEEWPSKRPAQSQQ